jgi:1,2-dihydroxy-3-keto-5-methylthiopentene dioxygenase
MSSLTVYPQSSPEHPNKVLGHAEDIVSTLGAVGVRFAQVPLQVPVTAGTDSAEILAASRGQIDLLLSEYAYTSFDLLNLCDERGVAEPVRRQAQTCKPAHFYYCLAGRAQLALHIGEYVYSLECVKGDLLLLPAGAVHWFDGGERPRVVMVRGFDSAQVPDFSVLEGDFAMGFAGLDDC